MALNFVEKLVSLNDRTITGRTLKTQARCVGPFAVHPRLKGPDEDHSKRRWSVSAVPCGLEVFRARNEGDAFRMAELLWTHCREAFKLATKEEVHAALTVESLQWLTRCHAGREIFEPLPERWLR